MNELLEVKTNKQGKQIVSARDLYDGLGLNRSEWSRWYKRNIEKNEFFKENVDWVGFITTPNRGGKPTQDFAITLDFAKHIAMMARTEKSHEYRNYFLECERRLNNISTISQKEKLLLQLFSKDSMEVANAHKQLVAIEVQEATKPLLDKIEEDKPLVTFADRRIKNEFPSIHKYLWKEYFWSKSYCLVTTGGAPLEVVKQYIENQGKR